MENIDVLNLFQGIGTMVAGGWFLAIARVVLVIIGFLLIYLGWKGILEPMIMIPMGLGMIAINCGTGMHLKRVAVPVRLSLSKIGEANILCARTRPKLIGGERAKYTEED